MDALYMMTLIPLAILAYAAVHRIVVKSREGRTEIFSWVMQALLLILPTISRRICHSFRCSLYDGGDYSYLSIDMNISCYSEEYVYLQVYAAAMLLIYPLGIPTCKFVPGVCMSMDSPGSARLYSYANEAPPPLVSQCSISCSDATVSA